MYRVETEVLEATIVTKKQAVEASNKNNETNNSQFRLYLLTLMVLQNSSFVLLGRYTRSASKIEDLYEIPHYIFIVELAKFILSCTLENYFTNGKLFGSIKEHIFDRPLDFLQVFIPSVLYLIQNSLLQGALSNLSAPLFQVTYQSKLLTTALASVALMQRQYTRRQWVCLTTLEIGVVIVVLGEKSTPSHFATSHENLALGLIYIAISCLCSALGGVYMEIILKGKGTLPTIHNSKTPASLWMRNLQMGFFSLIIATINIYFPIGSAPTDPSLPIKPFLHGFTYWVCIQVLLQTFGGFLVTAILKYADTVVKGLATGIAVVVSMILSNILFHTPLTMIFSVGATIILASVFIFSNQMVF